MRNELACSTLLIATISFLSGIEPAAAIKKAPYPEVKVNIADRYVPDAAFEAMRKALANAVSKKDASELFRLVGPTFTWTTLGGPNDQFDMGRNALDNFKVVFGFREFGSDSDGGVESGPFWDILATFAVDATYYKVPDAGNLVCGPISADVVDEDVQEKANDIIGTEDDQPDWYFTIADTPVAKAASDSGAPIAKIGKVALPVVSTYPDQKSASVPLPTHLEVLLPSGKSGWIPAAAARPLVSERLCYAKTPKGDWKIVNYDQVE